MSLELPVSLRVFTDKKLMVDNKIFQMPVRRRRLKQTKKNCALCLLSSININQLPAVNKSHLRCIGLDSSYAPQLDMEIILNSC